MKRVHTAFLFAVENCFNMSALKKDPSWYDAPLPSYPRLETDEPADVCIVGGGLTGVTAAYLLAKAGSRVVLIERDRLASGATGATTAFLSAVIDTDMADLVGTMGLAKARKVVDSHRSAIDTIEKLVDAERIECDFERCDNYMYATDGSERDALEDEGAAARKLGFDVADAAALGFSHAGAIAIKDQAKFHPLAYLGALAKKAVEYGARIYERSEAVSLEEGPCVRTKHGSVRAPHVFLATYEPFNKPLSLYFKKAFYTTYMYEGTLPKGAIPYGIYEDLKNPYQYFRIDAAGKKDRFIIGGQDHRSDVKVPAAKNFKALRDYIDERFGMHAYELTRQWSGPILEPIDGFPFIGPYAGKDVYVAMAFSGNGMTYATIAAEMFRDFVQGNGSPWTKLYDPARIPEMKDLYVKGRDYIGEFFGGAVHNALAYRAR